MSASEVDQFGSGEPLFGTSLYSGEPRGTYLKLPYIPPDAQKLKKYGAKVAFYGMPWDMTTNCRTGASYGPRGIREFSYQFLWYNANLDWNIVDVTRPVDCGDTHVTLGNPGKTLAQARADVGEIISAGALPVIFGGDHSISIATSRAVRDFHENPGMVLIDSHLDTAVQIGGETENSACPVARAVDAGFRGENIVLIGMNGWMNPRSELEYCWERGIKVIWCEDVWEKGTKWAVSCASEIAGTGTDGVYMSVDVDAIDAAYAPATAGPAFGGLTGREAIELIRGISAKGLLAIDIAEVAPSLECTQRTAGLALKLGLDAVAYHFGAGGSDARGTVWEREGVGES